MSFYRNTIRTARKEHVCSLCEGIIKKGEKYHDKAGNAVNCDAIFWGKECQACQPVIAEFFEKGGMYADDGYNADLLADWWREYKCCNCANLDELCQMTHYCRCEDFEALEVD